MAGLPHAIPMLRRTSSRPETANSFSRTWDVMLGPSCRRNLREEVDVSKRAENRCSWRLVYEEDPFLSTCLWRPAFPRCSTFYVCFFLAVEGVERTAARWFLSFVSFLVCWETRPVGCFYHAGGTVSLFHETTCFFVSTLSRAPRVVLHVHVLGSHVSWTSDVVTRTKTMRRGT